MARSDGPVSETEMVPSKGRYMSAISSLPYAIEDDRPHLHTSLDFMDTSRPPLTSICSLRELDRAASPCGDETYCHSQRTLNEELQL